MNMKDKEVIETLNDMKGVFGERGHSQYSLHSIDRTIAAIEKQMGKNNMYVLLHEGKPFLASDDINTLILWLTEERQSTQIKGMGWTFTNGFTIMNVEVIK